MKSTGIVRRIDSLGRIVLPAELREILGLQVGDLLEIFLDEDRIVLAPYQNSCIFCGRTKDLRQFKKKKICLSCKKKLASA